MCVSCTCRPNNAALGSGPSNASDPRAEGDGAPSVVSGLFWPRSERVDVSPAAVAADANVIVMTTSDTDRDSCDTLHDVDTTIVMNVVSDFSGSDELLPHSRQSIDREHVMYATSMIELAHQKPQQACSSRVFGRVFICKQIPRW